jgi:hypothetical protein
VLFATSVGGRALATRLESLLGAALALRGAKISVLLCDGVLPACIQCTVGWYPNAREFLAHGPKRDLCPNCHTPAADTYRALGFRVRRFSEMIDAADRETIVATVERLPTDAIAAYRYRGVAVGEQAMAGAIRFYARATLDEPQSDQVLRQFLVAAMLTALAMHRLLESEHVDCTVADHGIYVPQGVVGGVCRERGVRVVHWHPAYRERSFIFAHHDTYHHTLMNDPPGVWENLTLSDDAEAELTTYLQSRRHGTKDWISYSQPDTRLDAVTQALGIDWTRPCIGLLTNVLWDAQVNYTSRAFPNMLAWLVQTIEYFRRRPDLQLIVRVHPAELHGVVASRQRAVDEIRAHFPVIPPNVFVIGPEDRANTYAIMERCDTVLIYATTAGVELAPTGVPIVVAGEAWIRNKGITIDVSSPEEYLQVLDTLPLGAERDEARIARARLYAYHYYSRCMIPLEAVRPSEEHGPFVLDLQDIGQLAPQQSVGLDVICDGILHGTPFVYPAELQSVRASVAVRETDSARIARV